MTIKQIELDTVCGITSAIPQHNIPEIAFWGRSNVGKSSLLNTLWNRKNLARTSSEPGKTQTINYYRVTYIPDEQPLTSVTDGAAASKDLYMVDLPGYGYAKTSRETTAKWMDMIKKYLRTSSSLSMVCLLADSRHDPSVSDTEQYRLLESLGFNPLIIATKTDKLKKNVKKHQVSVIKKKLEKETNSQIEIVPFSSITKEGKNEILEYIQMAAEYRSFS
ncbi:MAG: YihA family ribosome biogenesis GTP-binding protein [Eubacterium sp.]|nr:YihA family ribosome biogenesis GTP-binding protein [Eubacterium sp.]